jgi:hypothetical protein
MVEESQFEKTFFQSSACSVRRGETFAAKASEERLVRERNPFPFRSLPKGERDRFFGPRQDRPCERLVLDHDNVEVDAVSHLKPLPCLSRSDFGENPNLEFPNRPPFFKSKNGERSSAALDFLYHSGYQEKLFRPKRNGAEDKTQDNGNEARPVDRRPEGEKNARHHFTLVNRRGRCQTRISPGIVGVFSSGISIRAGRVYFFEE